MSNSRTEEQIQAQILESANLIIIGVNKAFDRNISANSFKDIVLIELRRQYAHGWQDKKDSIMC